MIIGTAGHIDHGKSALVTALTGRAVDRLAEERRRGITIDLNFAPLALPGLPPIGIVDVPGHEDFVRTMVAGASGIDLVLLVVDAAQGPQPQTWEHLAVVEQLRIPSGIPVITKADLADPDWVELVASEVAARTSGSPVRFESPVIVSAVTRAGLDALTERIRAHAAAHPARGTGDAFRMPIDRAFSIAGVGTVVTGTPWTGEVRKNDAIAILPAGLTARVRSIETYGNQTEAAHPGARTAVGLVGVDKAALTRGDTLVLAKDRWAPTHALDVQVSWLPDAPPPRARLRVRVHIGTAEVIGRLHPRPGFSRETGGLARLALESPIVSRGGDRFVLRSFSPVATIGGGRVLDPLPSRRGAWPEGLAAEAPGPRCAALVARRAEGVAAEDLSLLLGLPAAESETVANGLKEVVLIGGRYVARATTAALRERVPALVSAFHRRQPSEKGMSLETLRKSLRGSLQVVSAVLDGMVRRGEVLLSEGMVAMPGFVPSIAGNAEAMDRVLEVISSAGLEPPTVSELESQTGLTGLLGVLRFAAQEGKLVAVERDRYFSPASLEQFRDVMRELAAISPVTPPALRDKLGLSRKFLIPLLEWADRSGLTRRVGDTRVLM